MPFGTDFRVRVYRMLVSNKNLEVSMNKILIAVMALTFIAAVSLALAERGDSRPAPERSRTHTKLILVQK
jgi:hypothetical protein